MIPWKHYLGIAIWSVIQTIILMAALFIFIPYTIFWPKVSMAVVLYAANFIGLITLVHIGIPTQPNANRPFNYRRKKQIINILLIIAILLLFWFTKNFIIR